MLIEKSAGDQMRLVHNNRVLIQQNEAYDFLGGGISVIEADYATVEDNFVHENA